MVCPNLIRSRSIQPLVCVLLLCLMPVALAAPQRVAVQFIAVGAVKIEEFGVKFDVHPAGHLKLMGNPRARLFVEEAVPGEQPPAVVYCKVGEGYLAVKSPFNHLAEPVVVETEEKTLEFFTKVEQVGGEPRYDRFYIHPLAADESSLLFTLSKPAGEMWYAASVECYNIGKFQRDGKRLAVINAMEHTGVALEMEKVATKLAARAIAFFSWEEDTPQNFTFRLSDEERVAYHLALADPGESLHLVILYPVRENRNAKQFMYLRSKLRPL